MDFKNKVMNNDITLVESRIKCELIDLPGIYHLNDPNFDIFYDVLS